MAVITQVRTAARRRHQHRSDGAIAVQKFAPDCESAPRQFLCPFRLAQVMGQRAATATAGRGHHHRVAMAAQQAQRGGVEQHLRALGFDVRLTLNESHLCCGSAGTYSVLQAKLSHQLLERKIGHLSALEPVVITSANIGCITHLQSGTATPV
ncbi:MAG: hypothetical protein IT469_11065, partial [Pseudomonadales bacterium]|nr:hypothetical protein [Pseudomonadales bacterium]